MRTVLQPVHPLCTDTLRTEIIISCAADSLQDIFGRDIEQSVQVPESPKRPTGIQVVDVYDRFHYFAVDQNMTFYVRCRNVFSACFSNI